MGHEPRSRVLNVLEATIGGTKRHLLELAPGLRALGWDLEVAAPRVRSEAHGDVSFWDDMRAAGVPLHALPMRRAAFDVANAAAIWRLTRLIRSDNYAIVHSHSSVAGAFARPATLLARVAAWGAGQSKIQNRLHPPRLRLPHPRQPRPAAPLPRRRAGAWACH